MNKPGVIEDILDEMRWSTSRIDRNNQRTT